MKAEVARKLEEKAQIVAGNYSKPRELNVTNEIFEVRKIKPLTDTTAEVVFLKTATTGAVKLAVAFFYYVPYQGGTWFHFFVSYNHLNSLERLRETLDKCEEYNYRQSQCIGAREASQGAEVRSKP